jgi:hypothetical protein
MRRSWLKFSLLVFLLASIFFIGSEHIAWASSDAAPLGQTVPTRVKTHTSTPVVASPTSKPPAPSVPTDTDVPQPVKPTASHAQASATLKPTSTYTQITVPTKPAPTITITKAKSTAVSVHIVTLTSNGIQETPSPQPTPSSENNMYLPATGGLLVVLLGVLGIIIWRNRTR